MQTVKLDNKQMSSFITTPGAVSAMVKGIKAAKIFKVFVDKHAGTISAVHRTSGIQVFAAIQKGSHQPWIVRHHKELFVSTEA
jgi:hypothetical protein